MFRSFALSVASLTVAVLQSSLSGQASTEITGRTIRLTSAPTVGTAMNVTVDHPISAAGRLYGIWWSRATDAALDLQLPFVRGLLRLDLSGLANPPFFLTVLSNTGSTTQPLPIPNVAALAGVNFDIQSFEFNLTNFEVLLADNDVHVRLITGLGSMTLIDGTRPSPIAGDFALRGVTNATMGSPANLALPKGTFQPILHRGQSGFVLGYPEGFIATAGTCDPGLHRRDRVARNLKSELFQSVSLPNGFDLAVLRHHAQCRQFSLLSIDRSTAVPSLLSGSTFADSTIACPPTRRFSLYRSRFAFSDDGELAAAIVHDSANTLAPNAGPPDRVLLIRTDPGKTWPNGRNVLDVTPPDLHQAFDGTLRFCGGRLFLEGGDRTGSGAVALWSGPDDGSTVFSRIALPKTGTNRDAFRSYATWRVRGDRRTMVFAIGGGTTSSTRFDDDILAIRNITRTSAPSVQQVSRFPTTTEVAGFGVDTTGADGTRCDLSPDGARVAFVTGCGDRALGSPHALWIGRTDGTGAGTLTAVTNGLFDAQVDFIGQVHFATNDRVLFAAGSDAATCDFYSYDIAQSRLTSVTKTSTGRASVPFTRGGTSGDVACRGTFRSDNGRFLYFVRGFGGIRATRLTNNLVAIDVTSLALRDITGNDFATGGTAPSIYRAPSTTELRMTTQPRPALELQLRRAPGSSTQAYFVAENANGVSATTFHDTNVFRFDIENATIASQLTSHTTTGPLASVRLINHLVLSPSGGHVAWTERLAATGAAEQVFARPTAAGSVRQLSRSVAGESVTDGTLTFLGAATEAVVWTSGRGSIAIPFFGVTGYWMQVARQRQPLILTEPSGPEPRSLLILIATPANR